MKKIRFSLLILSICMLFSLTGCKKITAKNISNSIINSLENVNIVTTKIIMTEKDVVVYKYSKQVKYNGQNATVTTEASTLDSKFELNTTTSEDQIENYPKKELFKLTINKDLVENFKQSKNKVSFEVSCENLSKVFNDSDLKCSGEKPKFNFIFEDGKVKSMTLKFTTEQSRNVEILCEYTY